MTKNNIDWVIEPNNENKGGLAIANIRYFQSGDLKADSIVGVVSVYGQKQLDIPKQIQHLRILINDNPKQNIHHFFATTYTYIQNHINKGNIVVHCHAGVSRSASIVIAYLIRKRRCSFKEAFELAKEKRPIICPNKGFEKQLKRYAQQVQLLPPESSKASCAIF